MSAIRRTISYELLQLKRSRSFWLLSIVLFVVSFYAAWYGKKEVQEQQRKINLVTTAIDSSMKFMSDYLQQHDSAAWDYDPLYKAVFYNRPDAMAALAFGQRDLHKFVIEVSEGTYLYNKYATGYTNKTLSAEINNPQKQLAGHLDLSFVVIFLFPLYLILVTYNVLSGEKERGTHAILGTQPVSLRRIYFARLFARWLCAITFTIGILVSAGLVTGACSDPRLLLFTGATILYSLFWTAVVAIISAFRKSSGFNALALISAWLLFCILIPAVCNSFLQVAYPISNKIALTNAVRTANASVFSMPRTEAADSFYKMYPLYDNLPGDSLPGGWYNPRWMRAVHALLDNKVERVEKQYHKTLVQRMDISGKLAYCSPAILTENIFVQLAASDLRQLHSFDTACWRYFKVWNRYLDDRIFFKNNRFSKADFKNLPDWQFRSHINYHQIAWQFAFLLMVVLLIWIIAARLLKNKY